MSIRLRKSEFEDLEFIIESEKVCFKPFQTSSIKSLRLSLLSESQEVWVAEKETNARHIRVGVLILHLRARSMRIYSISVLPEFRSLGIGLKLLNHACNQAIARGYERITLEASTKDENLINWYKKAGFEITKKIPDYYCEGESAFRMKFTISRQKRKNPVTNIIVVDDTRKCKLEIEDVRIISARSYISDSEFSSTPNLRVFNLCNSYKYQTLGYYVSLLASARGHRSIPSVTTIRDFGNIAVIRTIAGDSDEIIQQSLKKITSDKFVLNIYFGQTVDPSMKVLAHNLYLLYETPLLKVVFLRTEKWLIQKVSHMQLSDIIESDMGKISSFASAYFHKKRFQKPRLKHYKYNLAILVNPNEVYPPSNPEALRIFKNVANKIGFYVDFISKEDYNSIAEYDALFIRETTNVNDHTYQFSRRAYAEGLVVMDDPWSILRCSNKIYLFECMKQNRIEIPKTKIIEKGSLSNSGLTKFTFPLILKQPDSAFSMGVYKVNNKEEMTSSLKALFKKSELIIAQEFLPSEFDWRIGILDGKVLFACKYYMAKDHWQILNWQTSSDDFFGESQTIEIEKVPQKVIKTAIRAASLIGNGLYGVDLKEINGKVFVVEVNDNPNIDAGIEDAVLGRELYERIISFLFNFLEYSNNAARYIAFET